MCPICNKIIRSDAEIYEFCALCGMDIQEPSNSPNFKTIDGGVHYFCCQRCLNIYKEELA